jgi:hypothetical protein
MVEVSRGRRTMYVVVFGPGELVGWAARAGSITYQN